MPWQAFFDQLITISGVKNQEGGLLVTPKPRKKTTFLNPQTSCICTGTLKRWRGGGSQKFRPAKDVCSRLNWAKSRSIKGDRKIHVRAQVNFNHIVEQNRIFFNAS